MIYVNATNSFHTRARTGIQRAVRELGNRLRVDPDYRLVVLHEGAFCVLQGDEEMDAFMDGRPFAPRHPIDLGAIRAGDVFFDIDASWGDPCEVAPLWQFLKRRKCIMVKMHYDAVPLLFPSYSHENTVYRYMENFSAAIRYMDYWVCNSRAVERDLHRIVRETGMGGVKTFVCPLGANISVAEQPRPPESLVQRKTEIWILSYQFPFIRFTCSCASSALPNSDSETQMVTTTAIVIERFRFRPMPRSERM